QHRHPAYPLDWVKYHPFGASPVPSPQAGEGEEATHRICRGVCRRVCSSGHDSGGMAMTRWAGVRVSLRLAAVIVIVSIALSDAARAQDRVALVIGNSKYINVNALANAANDARAMARALRDIGFAVTDGYDLPRDGMERQIREFLRKSETARVR